MTLFIYLSPANGQDKQNTDQEPGPGKNYLGVSLIWEGESLQSQNLIAIERLRTSIPNLKLIHFISPSYFLKKGVDRSKQTELIKRAIKDGDQVGLNLHGWKSLMEHAKVLFRHQPSFWGPPTNRIRCDDDCGHDIPITTYNESEINRILHSSISLFEEIGLPRPVSFMAGGWLSNKTLQSAAASHGLIFDFSPVPLALVKDEIFRYPIYSWLEEMWPSEPTIAHLSPRKIGDKTIYLVPHSGATIEYVNSSFWLEQFKLIRNEQTQQNKGGSVMVIGFYQETAANSLHKLMSFFNRLDTYIEKEKTRYTFLELKSLADVEKILLP